MFREHKTVAWTLIAGISLSLLDTTIVGVAIPELASQFKAPISLLQWVSTAYTLAAACAVPVCAWATRRFGGRNLWVAGLLLFAAGSAAAGLSNGAGELIVFRIVQGIGASVLTPAMQSILVNAVGRDKLRTAMAAVAIPSVLAPIAGPAVGAMLLHLAPWPLIFWINLPVALLALLLAFRFLAKDATGPAEPFDFLGFLLLLLALLLPVWGFSGIAETTTTASRILALGAIAAGVLSFIGFARHALFRSRDPLLDLCLFGIFSFRASMGLLALSSFVAYGGIFLLPLFLVYVCHYSPPMAALFVAIMGLGALLSRFYLNAARQRHGVGNTALLATAGTLMGIALLMLPEIAQRPLLTGAAMLLHGAGLGLLVLLAMSTAYHDVARSKAPDAGSLSRVAALWGASLGTAAVAVLHQISLACDGNGFGLALSGLLAVAIFCALPAMAFKRAAQRGA